MVEFVFSKYFVSPGSVEERREGGIQYYPPALPSPLSDLQPARLVGWLLAQWLLTNNRNIAEVLGLPHLTSHHLPSPHITQQGIRNINWSD